MKFSKISNLYQSRLKVNFLFEKVFFSILKKYEILSDSRMKFSKISNLYQSRLKINFYLKKYFSQF